MQFCGTEPLTCGIGGYLDQRWTVWTLSCRQDTQCPLRVGELLDDVEKSTLWIYERLIPIAFSSETLPYAVIGGCQSGLLFTRDIKEDVRYGSSLKLNARCKNNLHCNKVHSYPKCGP